jgi:hypothetical protein
MTLTSDYLTRVESKKEFEAAWEAGRLDAQADHQSKEDFVEDMMSAIGKPSTAELRHIFRRVLSSTTDQKLIDLYIEALDSLSTDAPPTKPYKAMRALHDALERYISEGDTAQ